MRLYVLVARVESVCIICRMDRVDRRFHSSTILRLSTFFHADWLRLKAIVSLYRGGEEKPIERYKTRVEVAEED